MSGDRDDSTIWVTSTRSPDGRPVCEITWDGERWHAPVADIRATAIDLVTCAAYAEMMMRLADLGLPAAAVSNFASDLLSGAGRVMFGSRATFELLPAGSTKHRQPLVLLRRFANRAWDGSVSPDEARGMALQWLEAAEATESDQLVAEALRAVVKISGDETEKLFAYLRELRK